MYSTCLATRKSDEHLEESEWVFGLTSLVASARATRQRRDWLGQWTSAKGRTRKGDYGLLRTWLIATWLMATMGYSTKRATRNDTM